MLLIVSKPKILAEDLSDMMNFMGILSLAATPAEALFEINKKYRALIIISGEKLEDNIINALLLRARELSVPSFSSGDFFGEGTLFSISESASAAEILDAVKVFCKENGYRTPGEYKTHDFDFSPSRKNALCYSQSISFTKTESMILRVLTVFMNSPVSASEILKLAFRNKRLPDEAGVRTHISKINKKHMIISGRILILNCDKQGYILSKEEDKAKSYAL